MKRIFGTAFGVVKRRTCRSILCPLSESVQNEHAKFSPKNSNFARLSPVPFAAVPKRFDQFRYCLVWLPL